MSNLRSAFALTTTALLLLLPLGAYGQVAEPTIEYFVTVSKLNLTTGKYEVVQPKLGPYSREEAADVAKELQAEFPTSQFYEVTVTAVTKLPEPDGGNTEEGFRVIVRKKNPVTLAWDIVFRSEPQDDCEAAENYAATLTQDFPSPMYRILTPDVCNDDDDSNDGGNDDGGIDDGGTADGGIGGGGGGGLGEGLLSRLFALLAVLIFVLSQIFGTV